MRKTISISLSLLGALFILLVFTTSLALSSDASPSPDMSMLQPPGPPATYWGEVLPAPPGFMPTVGMTVTAMIGSYSCGDQDYYTTQSGGKIWYLVKVLSGGNCGASDRTITFWIDTQVMTPTADWPGDGATVELNLGPADIVYADSAGVCGGYTHIPCFTSTQAAIDTVATGGYVYVYTGTYTSTTLNKNVTVTGLGPLTMTHLTVQTGAFAAPSETLTLSGNLSYTGGTFDHSNGAIVFAGSGTQTISGDIPFYDLTVRTGVSLTTASNVTVDGTCTHEINSTTRETKAVGGTGPLTFVLAGATITPTTQGSLSSLQVTRVEKNHPQATSPIQTGRYWTIVPTGSGYVATLTVPHNEVPDAQDKVCRHEGAGQWHCAADSYDVANGTITRGNITQFSDWATGDDVPQVDQANPSITKTVNPPTAAPGWTITYTLVYANYGTEAATDVLITDVVPITLTDISFVSSGARITETGSVSYTWRVANLDPDTGGVITITGVVSPSASGVFSLTNRATITTTTVDVNPSNNASIVSHTIDAVPPLAPSLVSPADDALIGDATPTLTWQASPSPDVTGYLLDFGGTVSDVENVTQHTTAVLADGTYTWTAAAYDRAGHVSPYATVWSFNVDTTPPAMPTLVSPADGTLTNTNVITLTWSDESSSGAASYTLQLNSVPYTTAVPYSARVLSDDNYAWTVRALDDLGNASGYAATWHLSVDTIPPQVASASPSSGAANVSLPAPVVVTFSEAINVGTFAYMVMPNPSGWSETWSDDGTVVTLPHNPFAYQTTYTVTVTAADDLAGNPLADAPVRWHFTTTVRRVYLPLVARSI